MTDLWIVRAGRRVRAVPRECVVCGRQFLAIASLVKIGKGRACSIACRNIIGASNLKRGGTHGTAPQRVRHGLSRGRRKVAAANRAHVRVNKAVKRGELVRPTRCDKCQRAVTVEAHHEDYSQPLLVRWLCRQCHVDRHMEMERAGILPGGLS